VTHERRPYRLGLETFATERAARLAQSVRRERGEPSPDLAHFGPCPRHRDEPADEWHDCPTPADLLTRALRRTKVPRKR